MGLSPWVWLWKVMQGSCSDVPLLSKCCSLPMKDGGQACCPLGTWEAHPLPPHHWISTLLSTHCPGQISMPWPCCSLCSECLFCVPCAKSTYSLRHSSNILSSAAPALSILGPLYQPPLWASMSVLELNALWPLFCSVSVFDLPSQNQLLQYDCWT